MRRKSSTAVSKFQAAAYCAGALSIAVHATCLADVADAGREPISLEISAQSTDTALLDLAENARIQIVLETQIASTKSSPALNGVFTVRDALDKLLSETGLQYEFTSRRVVVVREVVTTENAEQVEEESSEQVYIENVVVTGTRLKQGDPSARVDVITNEQIRARGLSSAEEIIRSIPQNFSTINSATNLNIDGILDTNIGALGLGNATANLRGLGSRNTLVLVNGRRIAGTGAGDGDFFVNLRDIPAASIERVEFNLDGGSAVYGSDGLAGIINIILKKNYTGAHVSVLQELSSTGADRQQVSGSFGYGWGDGGFTLNLSYTESDPVNTIEAGNVTRDYSDLFGGNQSFNFRNADFGPYIGPAVSLSRFGGNLVNPGIDGVSYDPSDWRSPTLDDVADRAVRTDATGTSEDRSISIVFHQELFDQLNLRGEVFYTEADTKARVTTLSAGSTVVPASNAFNQFGQDVFVTYNIPEIASGGISAPFQTNGSEQLRYNLGVDWDINDDWQIVVDYNNSESKSVGEQFNFGVLSQRLVDEAESNGDLVERDRLQALRDEQLAVLASSDPNVAVNLFGDGSVQNLDSLNLLLTPIGSARDGAKLEEVNVHATGALWELPAGDLGIVIGYESRDQSLPEGAFSSIGVPEPTVEYEAWFVEFSVPLVSNQVWADSVVMTISARDDNYTSGGADGCAGPLVDFDCETPNLVEKEFSKVSPRLGFSWVVNDEITLRASRAESFRAPGFSDLFNSVQREFNFSQFDPLLGDFTPDPVPSEFRANIDLKPETSENISVGLTYTPKWAEGLVARLDYSELDYVDRIASSFELGGLLPAEIFGNLTEFFERDPNAVYPGTDVNVLTRVFNRPVNISNTLTETLDLDLSKTLDTDYGTFSPSLNIHYVLDQFDVPVHGAEEISRVGTTRGIDEYKVRVTLDWNRGPASGALIVNYTPSYDNTNFVDTSREFDPVTNPDGIPVLKVGSYLTVDASLNYQWDNGLSTRVGIRNLLDKDFPFALSFSEPYDAKRVDLRKRVAFVEIKYAYE